MAQPHNRPDAKAILRICLDVNVWVAHQLAAQHNRRGGSATALVEIVRDMECAIGPVQLVMSLEMIATLEDVLLRLEFEQQSVADFIAGLIGLIKAGPEQFDPHMLPERGGHFGMRDREDAAILASAIAARVDILVTNNLDDFAIKDCLRVNSRRITLRDQSTRQLFSLFYARNDGVSIVIAHPIDALDWLRAGLWPNAEAVANFAARQVSGA